MRSACVVVFSAVDGDSTQQIPRILFRPLKAKRALQEIWMAETKKDAVAALEAYVETCQIKYRELPIA
jgi:hypothetical protein